MAIEPVLIIPPGTVGYGIQLPVQSQSTIYVEDWELSSGPAEMARIARQADASGFLYVAVCDHTVIAPFSNWATAQEGPMDACA